MKSYSTGFRTGAVSSRGATVSTMPYSYSTGASYGTSYGGLTSRPATYTQAATRLPATTYSAGSTVAAARPATTTYPSTMLSGTRTIAASPTYANSGFTTLGATNTRVISGGTIRSAGIPATYIGGPATISASANLAAAGTVVSERVLSIEECYNTGMVRPEAVQQFEAAQPQLAAQIAGIVNQPVYGVQETYVQQEIPVTETIVGPTGQLEVVQAAEVVQTVVDQPVLIEQQVPLDVQQQVAPGPPRVLIVCTSANMLAENVPTGVWSEEVTGPFYAFSNAGCEVYFASIQGGPVTIDENSIAEGNATENDQRFQQDGLYESLNQTSKLGDINVEDIDCLWLAGGHGTCIDFESGLAQFVTDAVAYGRPVGAVCHGVIGLLSAINQDGTPLLGGRQCTGFSNAEEDAVGLSGVVPFLVQNRMQELGAAYSCAEPWSEYAIPDQFNQIFTGQNPQSSVACAGLCIQAMMPPAPQ